MIWSKKSFKFLLVLLLVIIGTTSCTISYADLNRNWSLQDVKNIIYKAKMNRNSNWQSAYISELDGQDNNLLPIVNAMNNFNYVYFVVRDTWNTYDIGLTNEPQHWYLYRNCPISKNTVTSGTNIGFSITYDSGNFTYIQNDMADHTSYDHKSAYEYYGMDIEYQNNNNIIYNGGYYSPNDFFNEWVWENSSFYISNNVLSSTQYVTINTVDGNITNIPILYTSDFGTLIDNDYLNYQNDNLDMYYWDNGSWVKKRLFFRIEPGLLNDNSYMTFNWNNDYNRCQLTIKDLYSFTNVLYHYDVQNVGNYQATSYFYIGDNNTSILNGTIDTYNLPSNYLDQFSNLDNMLNDNDNTEDIINTIMDDGEVSAMLNGFLSGDSGDIGATLGYHNYYNQYNDIYWGFVSAFCNVFYTEGDPYIDITLRDGTVRRIYSSEFTTPNTPLKLFISSLLVYLYVMVMLEVVRKWYIEITEGNLYVLHHADADEYFYM